MSLNDYARLSNNDLELYKQLSDSSYRSINGKRQSSRNFKRLAGSRRWILLCWEAEELDVDQARQRAERRARKHPLRQRLSSARVYISAILPSDGKRGG